LSNCYELDCNIKILITSNKNRITALSRFENRKKKKAENGLPEKRIVSVAAIIGIIRKV
jgi:hypothetical protein